MILEGLWAHRRIGRSEERGFYARNRSALRNNENRPIGRGAITIEAHMKVVKYGKYTGEPADVVDLDELMKRLGDSSCKAASNRSLRPLCSIPTNRWKPCATPFSVPCKKAIYCPTTP